MNKGRITVATRLIASLLDIKTMYTVTASRADNQSVVTRLIASLHRYNLHKIRLFDSTYFPSVG